MVNRSTTKGPLFYRVDPREFLREMPGIGSKLVPRIIEDLGNGDADEALCVIERNPYALIEIDGIGFRKADKIAVTTFDVADDDARRHEAANRFILEQKGVLGEREFTAERLKFELRDPAHLTSGVEVEDGLYWIPEELAAERGLETWMRHCVTGETQLADLTASQRAVCERLTLDEQQTTAVQAILANPVTLLTGGAGCGKTHIVAAAAQCLAVEGKTVRGMAFAGKAADRMREAFDKYGVMAEASTIHKALGFMKKAFTVPVLGEDLVVVDESSMLPNWLAWAVIMRLSPTTRIVFVGDPNQLPPIGYGTPFVDMVKHGLPRVHLLKNYRQQDQQGILHVAEGILHRKRPAPAECVDFHLGVGESNLEPLFKSLVEQHGGRDFNDWQVITYQNENAERYNLVAQEVINPDGEPLFEYPLWKLGTDLRNRPKYRATVRQGDKVIVVKNSTLLGIFNGQTGEVVGQTWKAKEVQRKQPDGSWAIEKGEHMMHLLVQIGRNTEAVAIPQDDLEKYIQLGYVITVHKAQGSDWDRVIVMQPGEVRGDTARRFFYTAVTRAKTQLVIVSMKTVVGWWTNASADAPDEPSSLMRRLARPAFVEPDPLPCEVCSAAPILDDDGWRCPFCEGDYDEGPAQRPVATPDPEPPCPAPIALKLPEGNPADSLPVATPIVLSLPVSSWRAGIEHIFSTRAPTGHSIPGKTEGIPDKGASIPDNELERVRREFAAMEVA